MIRKNKKWTIAASAFGYHAGVGRSKGKWKFIGGRGGLTEKIQSGVKTSQPPAKSTTFFSPTYSRKTVGLDGLLVNGLQKWCQIGTDDTKTPANKSWSFIKDGVRVAFLEINPDAIGGTITNDAQNYEYFKFKELELIFVMPSESGSVDGVSYQNVNLAVAHFVDSKIAATEAVSYTSIQSSNDMFEKQVVNPWGVFTWRPKNLKLSQVKYFNTELSQANNADDRMCCQGIIFGFYDQAMSSGTGSGNVFKIGDVYIKYSMALRGRISSNGITMQISNKPMAKAILKEMEAQQKDLKDDDNENKIVRRFQSMKRHLYEMVRDTGLNPAGPAVITIVDRKYDGTDPTLAATVSGGSLLVGGGTAVQDVNLQLIGGVPASSNSGTLITAVVNNSGTALDTNLVKLNGNIVNQDQPGELTMNLASINGTNISSSSASTGKLPVTVYDESNTYPLTVTSQNIVGVGVKNAGSIQAIPVDLTTQSLGNALVDLRAVNGTAVANEVPIDIKKVQGAVLSSFTNGVNLNGALPVQICGRSTATGNATGVAAVNVSTGGTPHLEVDTLGVDKKLEVNEKDYFLVDSDKKKKKEKGPKGPGDEEEEIPDIEDLDTYLKNEGYLNNLPTKLDMNLIVDQHMVSRGDIMYPDPRCRHCFKDGICIHCGYGRDERTQLCWIRSFEEFQKWKNVDRWTDETLLGRGPTKE